MNGSRALASACLVALAACGSSAAPGEGTGEETPVQPNSSQGNATSGSTGGGTASGGETPGSGSAPAPAEPSRPTDPREPPADAPSSPAVCPSQAGFQFGEAMTAAPGQWTFVPFPESRCMNGSPAGIGVNLSATSENVVIYLEGGGACFDPLTCAVAAHPNGFGERDLGGAVAGLGRGILNRNDPANPVRDWSYVFVPYCSGDVHAGNEPKGSGGRAHTGYTNVTRYLERIVPTFKGAKRVLLSGSSAGGFGAAYNYDQVARAFGCTRVDLLDDAGIPMSTEYLKPCLQELWANRWGLASTMPTDCSDCGPSQGGLVRALGRLAEKYPTRRFGYLSGAQDSVIRFFFGYGYSQSCSSPGNMSGERFQAGLFDVRDNTLAPYSNAAMFVVGGAGASQHTFLGGSLSQPVAGGVSLATWIRNLLDDASPSWTNAGP